jgi:hypothetical protein
MKPSKSTPPSTSNVSDRSQRSAQETPLGNSALSAPIDLSSLQSSQASRGSDDEIARRAYQRWQQSGASHGDDQRHWFEAEREVGQSSSGTVESERSSEMKRNGDSGSDSDSGQP